MGRKVIRVLRGSSAERTVDGQNSPIAHEQLLLGVPWRQQRLFCQFIHPSSIGHAVIERRVQSKFCCCFWPRLRLDFRPLTVGRTKSGPLKMGRGRFAFLELTRRMPGG